MSKARDFEERYRTGNLPWDTGKRDKNLEQVIKEYSISSCPVLEIGAGTASDAIWLAKHGFQVTTIDVSPTAVDIARRKAADAKVQVEFTVADVLKDRIPAGPFDFAFDRGCFHTFELPEERSRLAEIVWNHLNPDKYWFSLIGSTDGPRRETGPPRRSALDIASSVESRFEIISLKSILMDTNLPKAPRGWACLMRRRNLDQGEQ
jgi:SAM-dependent methyltransferase